MAVTVEDGTGVADANAYGETSDAQAYFDEMGYTVTATDAMVIRGARTLDAMYMHWLKGTKVDVGQSMIWPRVDMTDEDGNDLPSDEIPILWVRASFEMARIVPVDQSFSPSLFIQAVKAGSVEVKFAGQMVARQVLDFIQELVSPYVQSMELLRA